MKRIIFIILFFSFWVPCFLYADDLSANNEIIGVDIDTEEYFDDEFDALFDEAGEDIEVEDAAISGMENPKQDLKNDAATVVIRESSGPIQFSGSFESNIGAAATYNNGMFSAGGALTLSNSLYMTVRPASDLTLHASVDINNSSLANYSPLSLSSFYFDYLWRSFFISAGMRGLGWGNVRLFNTGTYGTVYTNVLSGFYPLLAQIQVPFYGNWTFVGAGNPDLGLRQIKYAVSYNNVLDHTNIDLYGTYTESSKAFGLELKRTIVGFDIYGQAIGKFESGYKKAYATAGIYRLWETDGPDYGFNFEYQFIHDRTLPLPEYHKIALETGIKKLGKKKNFKIGTQWGHNITDGTGFANVAFLFDGIFPHANWTNAISVKYGSGFSNPNITLGSTISLSIDY